MKQIKCYKLAGIWLSFQRDIAEDPPKKCRILFYYKLHTVFCFYNRKEKALYGFKPPNIIYAKFTIINPRNIALYSTAHQHAAKCACIWLNKEEIKSKMKENSHV